MQHRLIATLSTLILITATPSYSQEAVIISQNVNPNSVEITPFNLVKESYQGKFKPEIPSYGAFNSAVRAKKIKAIDLVKRAIAAGRLSEDRLDDQSYLNAVQTELDSLDHSN
jgi:hypothetical protein